MSPVSRGRKPKKKAVRKKPSPDEELREAFELILGDFAEVSTSDDALDVELLISGVIGSWWAPGRPDEADREFGFPLIAYVAGQRTPAALGLLRAMGALGVTDEQRERAGAAADRLEGVEEPPWVEGLRQVTVTECWQEADVYGDGASLLLICDRAGRRHGLVAEIDFNGGGVEDAFLTGEPDEVLREMRDGANETALVVTEPLTPARARRIIEDAMAVNDSVLELFGVAEPRDPLTEPRAYLLARLRAMPPAEYRTEPTVYSDVERDDLVRQFFAESEVTDDLDARRLARVIVDYGCDEDAGQPLRVGPEKLSVLVGELEATDELDDGTFEVLPDVLFGWARWAGARSGLSEDAIGVLVEEVDEIVDRLADQIGDGTEDEGADDLDGGDGDMPIALRRR